MEDIFGVSKGHSTAKLPVGTVPGGIDGKGHLGFAAQPGLAPFGADVFTRPGYLPPSTTRDGAAVAISSADFTVLDHFGNTLHPALVAGGRERLNGAIWFVRTRPIQGDIGNISWIRR